MTKRICWKKGMRLTDDILRASDNASAELVGKSLILAAAGRFGLYPSSHPFEFSLNINQGYVTIESLTCLAITKDGHLIDARYDTMYTNVFDTRVFLPEDYAEQEYILTINVEPSQWKDTNDGFEEPEYSFSVIAVNSPVPPNAMPIAHIVNDYGWRLDETDFVPPCLYVSSHWKYMEQMNQFLDTLHAIDSKMHRLIHSESKNAIRIFWPVIQQLMITVDKERDTMTPMSLLGNVQKCASAFYCACEMDDYLDLTDAEDFHNYIYAPYDYKDAYQRIKEGLNFCFSINDKIDRMGTSETRSNETIEAPTIDSSQLLKKCTRDKDKVRIPINNNTPGATVYYTTDGSEPSEYSDSGQLISLSGGFNALRKREPDKIYTVKVKAVKNGTSSRTNTYEITLQKDIANWDGKII